MNKDFFGTLNGNTDAYVLPKQTSYKNMPNLKVGDSGNDVLILQEKLKILGYQSVPVSEGFDSSIEKAVKDFQKDNNLMTTGSVDDTTWQPLFQQTESNFPNTPFSLTLPTLKLGDTGEYVTLLQTQLAQLFYYTDVIDGVFGTSTESAVKKFQAINHLTVDGIVARATWSALVYLYKPLAICGEGGQAPTENIHIVQAGDTLFSIANRYNTTVDAIIRLNNLTTNTLRIGQELLIPGQTPILPGAVIYTVQAGDTLFSIANRFNTTVDEIRRINNLTSDTLNIGQQLLVQRGENPNLGQFLQYTVVAGDTLFSIANRFNTTVDEIRRINSLASDILNIGQQLLLPREIITNEGQFFEYVVVAGDTLFSIARKYDTTVDEIMRINNLTNTTLSLEQILLLPRPTEVQYITHTIRAGDTLFSLARMYNSTVEAIQEYNNLTDDIINVGRRLIIPINII